MQLARQWCQKPDMDKFITCDKIVRLNKSVHKKEKKNNPPQYVCSQPELLQLNKEVHEPEHCKLSIQTFLFLFIHKKGLKLC